jgi:hypothetical protein
MSEKKKSNIDAKTTLDNLHQIQMNELQRNKTEIDELNITIQNLEDEIDSIKDIIIKTQKEDQLYKLKQKRKDLQEDKPLYDYLFNTGDILYNYYDLQDKIQKGVNSSKNFKIKPGSVLAAFFEADESEKKPIAVQIKPKEENRESLFKKFVNKIDPGCAITKINSFDDPFGICDKCDQEMIFSANEALFYCESCGHQDFILIDSDKPSYKDPPREVTYYAYKRINHFNELLAQFQAKESTEIPEEIFDEILGELKKERITNVEHITVKKIREILKKLKLTIYYEHVPYILNRINGKNAPIMTREIEEKLRFMFKEIQPSFVKHCPQDRSNFLSYSYVLYKFCELLELDEYLPCFSLLKNRDKLYLQDKIWELICKDMSWQFVRSL